MQQNEILASESTLYGQKLGTPAYHSHMQVFPSLLTQY